MHTMDDTYQSQETRYGHHVEATDYLHVHLHGRTRMQASFQTYKNVLYQAAKSISRDTATNV